MLGEQVLMQERELDGIGDGFDLGVESADVVVADVGHFLEHEVFDLGSGQFLEQTVGARVEEQAGPGPQRLGAQVVDHLDHTLFVGAADDDGTAPISEDLLEGHDLAGAVGVLRQHDVERLVEHDLLAAMSSPCQFGVERDTHLATRRVHIDRAVWRCGT